MHLIHSSSSNFVFAFLLSLTSFNDLATTAYLASRHVFRSWQQNHPTSPPSFPLDQVPLPQCCWMINTISLFLQLMFPCSIGASCQVRCHYLRWPGREFRSRHTIFLPGNSKHKRLGRRWRRRARGTESRRRRSVVASAHLKHKMKHKWNTGRFAGSSEKQNETQIIIIVQSRAR